MSLFDGMADWMNVPLLYFEGTGNAPQPRRPGASVRSAPMARFPTADGKLVLISIQNEREWARFCAEVLEEPGLPQTPGFQDNTTRVAHRAMVD